ncbi:MAG: hypothetical protein IJF14_00205 [Clostridia bacterium]|nr:hypothetical protein [Clostridia bacterium]
MQKTNIDVSILNYIIDKEASNHNMAHNDYIKFMERFIYDIWSVGLKLFCSNSFNFNYSKEQVEKVATAIHNSKLTDEDILKSMENPDFSKELLECCLDIYKLFPEKPPSVIEYVEKLLCLCSNCRNYNRCTNMAGHLTRYKYCEEQFEKYV